MINKLVKWLKKNVCKGCDYYCSENNVCQSKKCLTNNCHPYANWFDKHFCKPYKAEKEIETSEVDVVIKIPIEEYNLCKREWDTECLDTLMIAVKYGTLLPKGYGRLLILSENKLKENQVNLDFSRNKWISEVGLSNSIVKIIEEIE